MKRLLTILCALAFALNVHATDVKISDLPAVTSPSASDVLPIVSSSVTSKVTVENLRKVGSVTQAYDADLTTWAGITPGANVGTFLATPSSANLATAVTDETGSGALVFGTSPTFTTAVTLPATITGGAAATWTLTDNNASGLSIGSTGKADIIKVVTTDSSEGVTMSGTLGVTGAITGTVTGTASGNIANTLADAAGDMIYATADNTWAKLTAGTAGYVLKMGASVPEWSNSLSVLIDNSAAQFKDASVATKLVKINPTSEGTATITPTGAYNLTYTLTADSTPTFPTEGTLYGTKTDSITSANLAGSLSNETGTGVAVFATSPSFTTSILPVSNADIGSAAAEWGDVYLKDSAIIYGQADQSNTITSAATGWTFNLPVTIADDTNKNYIKITNNASRDATASVNEIYPEANIWKANQNGTESSIALSPTAGQVTFAGPTAARTITVPDVAFTAASICTASHDYGAAATAWTMTATESACAYIKVTNANGAVDAVVTVTPGRTYTIYNNSGQTLTFKASGKTGGTIANGKYAVYTSGDDDVYEVWEQS